MPTDTTPIEWKTKTCPTHGKFEGSHHWCTAMPCPDCGQFELYLIPHRMENSQDGVIGCYICERRADIR